MGALGAMGMAEQVDEGRIQLQQAISWHLSSNHYPPVPAFMVPVALAAVEAGQDEDWDRDVELPKGCTTHRTVHPTGGALEDDDSCVLEPAVQWRDREDGLARAGDVIESFHLDSFL